MRDFDSIYKEFQPKINRYLGNLVGEEDALDVTQAVFLKISRSLENFRGESSLSTWIYRIATNVALDHSRLASTRKTLVFLDTIDDNCDCSIINNENPPGADQGLMRREMNACIHRIVKRMPESERAVLILSEFEGIKNREIADILDISLNTVKIRLHRARARLRIEIKAECNLDRDERNELVCYPK